MNTQINYRSATSITTVIACLLVIGGCASTAPTKIGADTYFSSKTNTAGMFGDVTTLGGSLMAEGYLFCTGLGKEFELVTQNVTQPMVGSSLGGASITFKCVDNARNPVMRPDKGVTTIQNR